MIRFQRLLSAFELLQQEQNFFDTHKVDLPMYTKHEEITQLLEEYIEDVYARTNAYLLEQKVEQSKHFDITTLKTCINQLITKKIPKFTLSFPNSSREVNPEQLLQSMSDSLDIMNDNQKKWPPIEITLRLEMFFDTKFDEILMSNDIKNIDEVESLVNTTVAKLKRLSDEEMHLLWSKVPTQFIEDRSYPSLKKFDDIIPVEFWEKTTDLNLIRKKYAEFICYYKPKTVSRLIEQGQTSYPAGPPGLGIILGLSSNKVTRISNCDVLLVRSLSRICALYTEICHKKTDDLAKSTNIISDSYIFCGEYFHEYKATIATSLKLKNIIELLIINLKKTNEYALDYIKYNTSIEDALWKLKLGQEIEPDTVLNKKSKNLELILQKKLCKYLLEKNIFAFGRYFARSEIDLFLRYNGQNDVVIEVKVYRSNITKKQIQNDLSQLFSYMDQVENPKGILIIYNLTNRPILCPKHWIQSKFFIVCINLCEKTPSKRDHSIEITESKSSVSYIEFKTVTTND